MAAPISHIIYAKRYLESNPMLTPDKDLFLLGCSFPDIRRVDGTISREATHRSFAPINLDFEDLAPFEAGWKFHLYCDMKREEILRDNKFYSLKKDQSEKWLHPAKFLEDELLYGEYNNWEKLVSFFNHPPEVDMKVPITRESFELWCAMLSRYFEKKPDSKSIHIFLMKQHGLPDKVDNIVAIYEKLKEDEKIVNIIKKLASEIIPL